MSFPKYPKYKDSCISWVGEIPNHWNTTRLKNIFELMKREPNEGDEIVTAFRDGQVTLRSNRRIDGYTNAIHEHGYQRVLPEDLVIHAMDAFAGAIGVSDATGKSTPVYSVCRQRKSDTNVHYFGRLLRHMALSGFINSLSKGIRERSTEFRWNEASNVEVPLPPLPEQRAIATFLDRETAKIDALVAEQQRLIELLQEKRQAVISHAVTKGLNPHAPMKDSGIEWLGMVPEHWEVVLLKRIATVNTGVAKGKDLAGQQTINVPYLRVANVQDGYVSLDEVTTIDIQPHELDRYRLHTGDVLMNEGGDYDKLGRGCVWESQIEPCITQNHVFAVRPHSVDPWWLNSITSSEYAQFYFMSHSKQSTNLASISSTNLMNLPVVLPGTVEQQEILSFVRCAVQKFDSLITQAQRAIDLLQERRTALISAAVTGKIDVRHLAQTKVSA